MRRPTANGNPAEPASATPRHRRLRSAIGVALLLCLLPTGQDRHAHERSARRGPSGAFQSFDFWSASRAYPGADIPDGAHMRAYEYSRAFLRHLPEERPGDRGRAIPLELRRAQSASWQPIGPTNGGGRTLTIAFDPSNPDIVYAGSASGGLWKSATGGVGADAWRRVETGFPVMGVSSIAFAPGGVMYIGTGEVYNRLKTGDLAADRATRGSYGIGILKSADGGATWARSLDWSYAQGRGVWAVRVSPADPAVVWAATTEGAYKSVDAGRNWERRLAVAMAMDLVIHPTNPDRVLVACGNLSSPGRGIYRTTDGGEGWAQIVGGGVPADFAGKIQFGVTPADPDLVFASVGNGFNVNGPDNRTWLLRSSDFGASWSLRTTTDYARWQGWFSHDVAVHPVHPDTVICIGIDVWRSSDGGATLGQRSNWMTYYPGDRPPGSPEGAPDYSHADHHDVAYHPTNPSIVYFANDGGVSRSIDGGQTFESVNGGYQSTQFYNGTVSHAASANLSMGGLQDNGSAIYRGGGQWARWILGGDGGWCAIDANNPNVVFATAQWLYVGRSTNGGASFSVVSPPALGGPVAFIAPLLMSPTNAQVLYAGSSYLFKTFNGGGLWYLGNQGAPIDGNPLLLFALPRNTDAVLYMATAPFTGRGRVYRSLNGGATVTQITGTLPDRYPGDMTVDPTNQAVVYLTLSGFGTSHVFRSADHGATWVDIDGGRLPDVPTTAVVVDPLFPNHVYVGNDIGVYLTVDGGANWAQLGLGLPEAVLVADLGISPADRKLRVFTHGFGAYERDLLDGVVAVAPPAPTGGPALHASAPNPFSDRTTIRFELARGGPADLRVYDLRGARVRTLAEGARAPGTHRVEWDGRDDRGRRVAPGSYFCRLEAGGTSATRRIVRVE